MTTEEMTVDSRKDALQNAYYASDILAATGISTKAILIPNGDITSIAWQLEGASAKIQATVYPIEDIESGSALWEDVPEDNVLQPAVQAIRLVSLDGAAILNIRCQ